MQRGKLPLARAAREVVPTRLQAQLAPFGERQRTVGTIHFFFDDRMLAHQRGQRLHIGRITALVTRALQMRRARVAQQRQRMQCCHVFD